MCLSDRTAPTLLPCEIGLLHDSFHRFPLQLPGRLHAQTVTLLNSLTGGWLTAYAHIVTAVIGSGVLSLAWSMSWLGRLPTDCVMGRAA